MEDQNFTNIYRIKIYAKIRLGDIKVYIYITRLKYNTQTK